jgi:hypothetical protein
MRSATITTRVCAVLLAALLPLLAAAGFPRENHASFSGETHAGARHLSIPRGAHLINPDAGTNQLVGIVTIRGDFLVKQGNLSGSWIDEDGPSSGSPAVVTKGFVSGHLLGVIDSDGSFWVKDGLFGQWESRTPPFAFVTSAAVYGDSSNPANDRIAVVGANGEAFAAQGFSSPLIDEWGPDFGLPPVQDVQASGDLLGIVINQTNGNEFWLKQGNLSAGWINEYGPDFGLPSVASAAVYGDDSNPFTDRIAIRTIDEEVLAKQGNMSGDWTNEYGPDFGLDHVIQVYVSGDLIGIVTANNEFLVKQGDLSADWINEYGPDFPLAPVLGAAVFGDPANPGNDRVAVALSNGEALAKQGDLSGGWVDLYGPNYGLPHVESVVLG